jgi:single-stranded-DNA-specific exonuclease
VQTCWSLYSNKSYSKELLELAGSDTLVARLLTNRGIASIDAARYFLDLNSVKETDPLEIPEMDKAFCRIKSAIEKKERIIIYGDYDVDGTSSVALLYRTFRMIGCEVDFYIPSRHSEGYGLNKSALEKFKIDGIQLVISCDCGISNYDEVEFANTIGLDVIVTDHHSIPANPPPSVANCNPKTLPESHPLHYLPGVGVAYKLAELLLKSFSDNAIAYSKSLLDLVALGMVADMAPLLAENRYLTIEGLKVLTRTEKPGLIELMRAVGLRSNNGVTNSNEESIGFGLAPRINAAGRLADATRAVKLMITEDFIEANELCHELSTENRDRQELCAEIYEEAFSMVNDEMLDCNVIVLGKEAWHHGVIGIVASRLLEAFHLPVFIMSLEEDKLRGSVRCINLAGLDIYQEMKIIQEKHQVFSKFGGHKMAAGFSAELSSYEELRKAILSRFKERLTGENTSKNIKIDTALRLNELDEKFLSRLSKLAPYGVDNPQPKFVSGPLLIERMKFIGQDEKHLKLFVTEEINGNKTRSIEAVIWNRAQEFVAEFAIGLKHKICFVYTPKLNEYMGEISIQLDIRDWKRPEETPQELFARFNQHLQFSSS